jgi:Zn-dependent peptidase ImmA (M78 family)
MRSLLIMSATSIVIGATILYACMPEEIPQVIHRLNDDAETLVRHMVRKYPTNPGVRLMRTRFKEGSIRKGTSTYTVNKGEKIYICTRAKSYNTLMYVMIHELAHVADKDHDPTHADPFRVCFKLLLAEAMDIGLYRPVDYAKSPELYCNLILDNAAYLPN